MVPEWLLLRKGCIAHNGRAFEARQQHLTWAGFRAVKKAPFLYMVTEEAVAVLTVASSISFFPTPAVSLYFANKQKTNNDFKRHQRSVSCRFLGF